MLVRRAVVAFLVLTCLSGVAYADDDFEGVVTKVFDGDSFLVRPAKGRDIDVRLLDIDAPEKGQQHADESRAALKAMIEGRRVYVDVIDTDQYHRKLAHVYRTPDRLDVARALLHDGHVWVYRNVREPALLKLQSDAQRARVGLWRLSTVDRIPPWEYRRRKRSALTN